MQKQRGVQGASHGSNWESKSGGFLFRFFFFAFLKKFFLTLKNQYRKI